jgi:excisionase family DNA binding protein
MSDIVDDLLPRLPGYVSVKEAAKILGVSERSVYEYVEEGRLPGARIADVIAIPLEAVQKFKRGVTGKERKTIPLWRIASIDNTRFITVIAVQIRRNKRGVLIDRFEEIRKSKEHLFPGTVARYIMDSKTHPGRVMIFLIWRATVMPEEAEREKALEAFRQELGDVLNWETAEYEHGTAFMHT